MIPTNLILTPPKLTAVSKITRKKKKNSNNHIQSAEEVVYHFLPPTIFWLVGPDKLGDALLVGLNLPSPLLNTSRSSNNLYDGIKGFCPAPDLGLELVCACACACASPLVKLYCTLPLFEGIGLGFENVYIELLVLK